MFILEAVKSDVQLKAAVAAQQHHVGVRHFLPCQKKPFACVFFVVEHHSLDAHAAEILLILRMVVGGLSVLFQSCNAGLLLLNLFGVIFQQLIFQTILLVLEIAAQDFQFGNLHVQIHLFPDARVAGAQSLYLGVR